MKSNWFPTISIQIFINSNPCSVAPVAKRKLSKQQQRRVTRQLDKRRQQLKDTDKYNSGEKEQAGLIISHHGKTLIVENHQGKHYRCSTRQNIGQPVCGDRIVWHPVNESEGIITAILERDSLLVRPGFADKIKPVAANVTLIGIVISPTPEPQEKLIDSYLVAAKYLGIRPLLISNKSDLLSDSELIVWKERFSVYLNIGYPWLMTSTKQAKGTDGLLLQLQGNNSILVGQSGTGKSSLINALIPDKQIKTSALSKQIGKGQHTTSYSALYHLPGGHGNLIDSPGVRDFRLGHLAAKDIEQGFVEFGPYLGNCRFSDCRHQNEPDCAIRSAVSAGEISAARLDRYFSIMQEHSLSNQ